MNSTVLFNSINEINSTNTTENLNSNINNNKNVIPNSKTIEIIVHYKDDAILNGISVLDLLIIVLGTLGNLTSFYLLTRKGLRPVSSMRYLASLTIVDTICLYGWYLSSVYKQLTGEQAKRLENISALSCKSISYISFVSLQLSSVLLCMLTIDRLLIIVSSMWRSKYANPKFANRIILASTVFVGLLNLIIPFRLGNNGFIQYTIKEYDGSTPQLLQSSNEYVDISYHDTKTQYHADLVTTSSSLNRTLFLCYDENDKVLKAWRKLHLCLYSLIPFPILYILNLIVIRMTRVAASSSVNINVNLKKFKHGQQFVTRLLLFLTISFFLTTLPSTVVYAFWREKILSIKFGRVILNLLNTLQFSRHSSNWIIYIYSSNFMREEFKKCIACADSDYELAQAALAQRPSIAIEILRQLEQQQQQQQQSLHEDFDYRFYYNYYKHKMKKNTNESSGLDDEPMSNSRFSERKIHNTLNQNSEPIEEEEEEEETSLKNST